MILFIYKNTKLFLPKTATYVKKMARLGYQLELNDECTIKK
jgi:hypothetical protein